MAGGTPWTAEEIETLTALYDQRMTKHLLGVLPGRTRDAIALKARSLGLRANRKLTRKRHTLNYDYFAVPNLENSYWAGFMAADGCVDDVKDRIRVKLCEQDAHHLARFNACCGSSSPIRDAPNGQRNYKSLEIMGTGRWREDLRNNFCITPRKTLTLQPPAHLPHDLSLAFITGYIDGDGCISMEQLQRGLPRLRLQITGTREVLLWIKSWFDTLAPSSYQANVCPMGKVCSYKIVGHKAESVCRALMVLQTPRLQRKWDKATRFLQQKEELRNV